METTITNNSYPVAVTVTLEVDGSPKLFCFDYFRGSLFSRACRQDETSGPPCGSIDRSKLSKPVSSAPVPLERRKPGIRGLGDVVAKVTSALGIKQKPGCKCKQRQEKLNKLVPFKPGDA